MVWNAGLGDQVNNKMDIEIKDMLKYQNRFLKSAF